MVQNVSVLLLGACLVWNLVSTVNGRGLLLLYRPRDISMDCAFSEHLRYDLSFGMGMSDTITLVFRTLTEIDYECAVEIATEYNKDVALLVVIKFPISIGFNCKYNQNAFTVLKKAECLQLCDQVGNRDIHSPYFTLSVTGRIRFRFVSNSSINSDINAYQYEVTATSARKNPGIRCDNVNETVCVMGHDTFCFTSGVVCDGIKNCGVPDWFDERKSDCELPVERLGYTPVIAAAAALVCALLAAIHILMKFMPPLANSFFIFNANEDNRLCIVPVFRYPDVHPIDMESVKRNSVIPVYSSASSSDNDEVEKTQQSEISKPESHSCSLYLTENSTTTVSVSGLRNFTYSYFNVHSDFDASNKHRTHAHSEGTYCSKICP